MSKKYVTRRFRKLHKGRKGRKGRTTRKKMDGGWRMWNNVLSQFKNKINDVPALKRALDSYRNTGKDEVGADKRNKILGKVTLICDKYLKNPDVENAAQFYALKDFAVSNTDELNAKIKDDVDVEKRNFYEKLLDMLLTKSSTSLPWMVLAPTVQKQNLETRALWNPLRIFKSKIKNVEALKRLLDEYRGAGIENDKFRDVIIDQVKQFISNTNQSIRDRSMGIGMGVPVDVKFIELLNFVSSDPASQTLKTFIENQKNPIDKREFYQAVYNSLVPSPLNVSHVPSVMPNSNSVPTLGPVPAASSMDSVPPQPNLFSSLSTQPVATLASAVPESPNPAAAAAYHNTRVPATATQAVDVMPSSNSSSMDSVPPQPNLFSSLSTQPVATLASAVLESPNPAAAAAAAYPNARVPAEATQPLIAPTNMGVQATRLISDSSYTLPMTQYGRTTENVQNPDGTDSLGDASVLQRTLPMPDPPTYLKGAVDGSRANPPAEEAMYSSTNQAGPSSQHESTSYGRGTLDSRRGESGAALASYVRNSRAHSALRPNRRKVTLNLGGGTKYTGEVNDEGEPDGFGLIIYASGNKYQGEFSNGAMDGYGTFTWVDGDSYRGGFKNNKRNDGFGTYTWENGTSYQGEFVNERRNGLGTFNYENGNKYEGNWKNDMKNGLGTEKYEDNSTLPQDEGGAAYSAGDVYIGYFKDGKRHGEFSYKFFNHMDEIQEGEYTYVNGKCEGFDILQQKMLRDDLSAEQFRVHRVNEKGGPKHIGTGTGTITSHEGNIGYHGSFGGKPPGKEPHRFWVYPRDKAIGDKQWDTHDPESFCTNKDWKADVGDIDELECKGHRINEEGDSEETFLAGGTAYKPNRRKTNKKITRKRKSPRKSPRKSTRKSTRK